MTNFHIIFIFCCLLTILLSPLYITFLFLRPSVLLSLSLSLARFMSTHRPYSGVARLPSSSWKLVVQGELLIRLSTYSMYSLSVKPFTNTVVPIKVDPFTTSARRLTPNVKRRSPKKLLRH